MLREPSGLRVQPSYAGWTLCPELNFSSLVAISWPWAVMARPANRMSAAANRIRLLIRIAELRAFSDFGFVVGLFEVRPRDPRKTHFVDRALPVAAPVPWIRIRSVRLRIVVPQGSVQHGASRQQRADAVGVVVDLVPVEVPSHAVELQGGVGRQNRLEAHPLADVVHVRLDGRDLHGLVEAVVAL